MLLAAVVIALGGRTQADKPLREFMESGPGSPGFAWRSFGLGGGGAVMCVAIDPTNPDIAYAGGDVEGYFKTTDGGRTWRCLNTALAGADVRRHSHHIMAIAVDPNRPSHVYVGAGGVFKSTDYGETFISILPRCREVVAKPSRIVVDPADSDTLYVCFGPFTWGENGTFWVSRDGGATWDLRTEGLPPKTRLLGMAVDPEGVPGARTVYVSGDAGVFKSNDSGRHWRPVNAGLPAKEATRIALSAPDATGRRTLFVALAAHGLFLSRDGGETWGAAKEQLPSPERIQWWLVVCDPRRPGRVYVGDRNLGRLFRTDDGGASWTNVRCGKYVNRWWYPVGWHRLHGLALCRDHPEVLYATDNNGVSRTADAGASWEQLNSTWLRQDPELKAQWRPDLLKHVWWWLPEQAYGSWWRSRGMELVFCQAIAVEPSTEKLFLGLWDMRVWRSDDHGETFTTGGYRGMLPANRSEIDDGSVSALLLEPARPGTLYAGTHVKAKLYRSDDFGASWRRLSGPTLNSSGNHNGIESLLLDPGSPPERRTFYAAVYDQGVMRSVDGGVTWEALNKGLRETGRVRLEQLAMHPSDPKLLFAALRAGPAPDRPTRQCIGPRDTPGGVFRSRDGGESWVKVNRGVDLHDVWAVAVDPQDPKVIFAATSINHTPGEPAWPGGLWRTTDGGTRWQRVIEAPYVSAVAISPWNSDVIYAGLADYYFHHKRHPIGVWRSGDRGATWRPVNTGLTHFWPMTFAFHPNKRDIVYLGTRGGGAFVGRDPSP